MRIIAITIVARWFVALVASMLGLHAYELSFPQAIIWFRASHIIGFGNAVACSIALTVAAVVYRGAPRELSTRSASTATAALASTLGILPVVIAVVTARAAARPDFSPSLLARIGAIETTVATIVHVAFILATASLVTRTHDALSQPHPRRLGLLVGAAIVLTLTARVAFVESILRAVFGISALWALFALQAVVGGLVAFGWARIFRDTARLVGAQTTPEPASENARSHA
jgi:hypothetical protein